MKIALISLKGGVGKTTSAHLLASRLALRGRTVLIDADPQGSAQSWADVAGQLSYDTAPLPTATLHTQLPALEGHYAHIVIDTPPGHPNIITSALLATELVLIPISPNMIEIDRLHPTIALMAEVEAVNPDLDVRLLFTRVRKGTVSHRDARRYLADHLGLPVLQTEIPLRERFGSAFGLPPRDLGDYENVLRELLGEPPIEEGRAALNAVIERPARPAPLEEPAVDQQLEPETAAAVEADTPQVDPAACDHSLILADQNQHRWAGGRYQELHTCQACHAYAFATDPAEALTGIIQASGGAL